MPPLGVASLTLADELDNRYHCKSISQFLMPCALQELQYYYSRPASSKRSHTSLPVLNPTAPPLKRLPARPHTVQAQPKLPAARPLDAVPQDPHQVQIWAESPARAAYGLGALPHLAQRVGSLGGSQFAGALERLLERVVLELVPPGAEAVPVEEDEVVADGRGRAVAGPLARRIPVEEGADVRGRVHEDPVDLAADVRLAALEFACGNRVRGPYGAVGWVSAGKGGEVLPRMSCRSSPWSFGIGNWKPELTSSPNPCRCWRRIIQLRPEKCSGRSSTYANTSIRQYASSAPQSSPARPTFPGATDSANAF